MSEIPADVMATARGISTNYRLQLDIAAALLAEREAATARERARCAGIAHERRERITVLEGVEMSCKEVTPGKTMQELMLIFTEAKKDGSPFAGNPSKWPDVMGISAVVKAVLDGIAAAIRSPDKDRGGEDNGEG